MTKAASLDSGVPLSRHADFPYWGPYAASIAGSGIRPFAGHTSALSILRVGLSHYRGSIWCHRPRPERVH
jgi:hypothetical protein